MELGAMNVGRAGLPSCANLDDSEGIHQGANQSLATSMHSRPSQLTSSYLVLGGKGVDVWWVGIGGLWVKDQGVSVIPGGGAFGRRSGLGFDLALLRKTSNTKVVNTKDKTGPIKATEI